MRELVSSTALMPCHYTKFAFSLGKFTMLHADLNATRNLTLNAESP